MSSSGINNDNVNPGSNNVNSASSVPKGSDESTRKAVQTAASRVLGNPDLYPQIARFLSVPNADVSRRSNEIQNKYNAQIVGCISKELPQFQAITEELRFRNPGVSPSMALKEIAEYAKTEMLAAQYSAIRSKYDGPLCIEFFQELHTTIKTNHDEATVFLGEKLRIPGIDNKLPVEQQAQVVRAWCDDSANTTKITNIALSTSRRNRFQLKVAPKELSKFLNLKTFSTNATKVKLPLNMPVLERLTLDKSKLKALQLPLNVPALKTLDLSGIDLKELQLPLNMPALETLNLKNTKLRGDLQLPPNMPALQTLDLSLNSLTDVKLPLNMPALRTLNLENNLLTKMNLSNQQSLRVLKLSSNNLTSVNLPGNNRLVTLELAGNKLTSVDLSNQESLQELSLSKNRLTEVQLPKEMLALQHFSLSSNQLTSVDLPEMPELRRLTLRNNQLAEDAQQQLLVSYAHLEAGFDI